MVGRSTATWTSPKLRSSRTDVVTTSSDRPGDRCIGPVGADGRRRRKVRPGRGIRRQPGEIAEHRVDHEPVGAVLGHRRRCIRRPSTVRLRIDMGEIHEDAESFHDVAVPGR
jgi:hypothetical protein